MGYKVNMPQRGDLHAVKVLNDQASILAFLNGNTEAFLTSDNFQRKFMHEYPKLMWANEKHEDIGDFVLLFPNPARVENRTIDIDEADENFSDIFNTPYSYPYKKKFMTALKEAHDEAFLDLDLAPELKKKRLVVRASNMKPATSSNPGSPYVGARSPKNLQCKFPSISWFTKGR